MSDDGLGSTNIIIINHVSIECILAKCSRDLHSNKPGDAVQARTAGTIKATR